MRLDTRFPQMAQDTSMATELTELWPAGQAASLLEGFSRARRCDEVIFQEAIVLASSEKQWIYAAVFDSCSMTYTIQYHQYHTFCLLHAMFCVPFSCTKLSNSFELCEFVLSRPAGWSWPGWIKWNPRSWRTWWQPLLVPALYLGHFEALDILILYHWSWVVVSF